MDVERIVEELDQDAGDSDVPVWADPRLIGLDADAADAAETESE